MQQDLCEAGSLVFFEQNEDALPEPNEADQMIETGDADFHYRAGTVPEFCMQQVPYLSVVQP